MFDKSLYEKYRGKKGGIVVLETVDSTNAYAITHDLAPLTCVVAETQTAGRGRSGRKWFSEPEANLYFSVVLRDMDVKSLLPMNIFAGYVMADTLKPVLEIKIKWPNDIMASGKKIAGLLMETSFSGGVLERSVLGIGLNVNGMQFPDELKEKATSIKAETKRSFSREELLAAFITNLENRYDDFLRKDVDIQALWPYYSAFLGQKISVHKDGVKTVYTEKGIDSFGCLLALNDAGRLETIVTGDIGYDLCR